MNKRARIALAGLLAAVVVIGGGLYWYLRDDAPAAVNLETAANAVADTSESSDGEATSEDSASAAPVELPGVWNVDADSGEFDFESATGTFAGFRVQEQLAEIGSATAVGRTGEVSGSIEITGTTLNAATFEVDLTTITTNDRGRDGKVQGALETSAFPTAKFVLTQPVDLGAGAASGAATSVTAVGDLTIHGVTKAVEFPLEAKLVGSTIVVVGSLDLSFADYGVSPPTAPIVLSVEDHGVLEVQVLLVKS